MILDQGYQVVQEEVLEDQEGDSEIRFRGDSYRLNVNNSGPGELCAKGECVAFQSSVYLSQWLPLDPGAKVIEFDRFEDGRTEWSLARVVEAKELEVERAVKPGAAETVS